MPSEAAPVSASERILTLDMIRGFALLGIFIMNMPGFNASFFAGADGTRLWPEWWNVSADTARHVLFSGKFNSMFSMLFAIGFTIQLERLEERDPQHAKSIYLRRIFWLFIFGAIHSLVFWTGDVLHMYALFGLVLLALRRATDKLLWTLFAACLLYPIAAGIFRLVTTTAADVEQAVATLKLWEASNNAAYGGGSFLAAAREHVREMIFLYTDPEERISTVGFYVQIFSTMLIGLMLGRHHVFQDIARHLPRVKRLQWWALALGIAAGAVFGFWEATATDPLRPTPFRMVAILCYYVSRLLIMAFYVATIIRAVNNTVWRQRLMPIAMAGRMPLTNYLLQTLIATFIFYGWGLGYWGKVGPALDIALALAIFFVIQVSLSCAWLARYSMGPMEYLWRLLTYGRASLKRSVAGREAAA
jgi:uncharacterized protein